MYESLDQNARDSGCRYFHYTLIPFADFFRNVDILIHELFHTLTTLLLSGQVNHIHLYADQSGITLSSYNQGWMIIPIALAVLSPIVLVALAIIDLSTAGDSTILAEATYVPAIVWALLLAAFLLWCAKKATSLLIKSSWIAKFNAN